MLEEEIVISHPRIIKYFNDNPELDPEDSFLFFIEFLDKIGNSVFDKMDTTNKQLLSSISGLNESYQSIKENMTKINAEVVSSVCNNMNGFKNDYVEEVKELIHNNTTANNEKINFIVEKNNLQLLDRTNILLNDIIPKNTQGIYANMEMHIRSFQQTLKESLSYDTNIKDYINNLEMKFNKMLQEIQHPIHSYIMNSEDRLTANISTIKELAVNNNTTQSTIQQEMSDFLNRYKHSSTKGVMGEAQLYMLLNKMYPTAHINDMTGQKASGDFMLKRNGKPSILIETKDYSSNVPKEETDKFIRDVALQKCNGIFLSQSSGIALKDNYQIEFNKGTILVYIHNCDYAPERIQIAVDIIDNMSLKFSELELSSEDADEDINRISVIVLDEIYAEFQEFALKKDALITLLKDTNKRLITQADELRMPGLNKYLNARYATTSSLDKLKNKYVCSMCENFSATSLKSLSAHKRGCPCKGSSADKSKIPHISPVFVPSPGAISKTS
jgi:hypothetical protein